MVYCKEMNWFNTVKKHPTVVFNEESQKHKDTLEWWEDVEDEAFNFNIKGLWQYFGMQWWNEFGHQYYPHIIMLA